MAPENFSVDGGPSASSIAELKTLVDADKALDTAQATASALADVKTYAVRLAETGPTALDATGGAAPSALVEIPAGAASYSVGTCDSTRAAALTGYAAPSNNPRTKSGEIVAFGSGGIIPTKLDDNSAPTHLFVVNTAATAGWVWIQWYK